MRINQSILFGGTLLGAVLVPVISSSGAPAMHSIISSYEGSHSCTFCHVNAASQVMHTVHWTWDYTDPVNGDKLGKKNVINNYCVATPSNEPRCTSCHVGWGYSNKDFNFNNPTNVDCLVCHDTTGTYKKFPTGSGYPVIGAPKEFPPGSGNMWNPPDLTYIARNAGKSSRANCGACHFFGGGGDAVKHGDLDSTMTNPDRMLDVHMGTNGLNFTCANCHLPTNAPRHEILGSPYTQNTTNVLSCEMCHDSDPHSSATDPQLASRLNAHTATVACQTCHIPRFARGGKATKMFWDWSTAGRKDTNGNNFVIKDAKGNPVYDTQKGSFAWEANVAPQYRWFNGAVDFVTLDDPVSSNSLVTINALQGSLSDTNSRIYPVKHFTGVQPYDAGSNTLAVPHLFGSDTNAYWKAYDWNKALAAGMAYVGREYSGQLGFLSTEMYWIQNHMVAPKEYALHCVDCHTPRGQLKFGQLGYAADRVDKLQNLAGFEVSPTLLGGGSAGLQLNFRLVPGYIYQIQSSTDFSAWTDVTNGRFEGGASAVDQTWTDDSPAGTEKKYYRIIRTLAP